MSVIIDGTTGIVAPNITDSSLTSGRVPFITTNGDITDSANLVFSGTTLTTTGLNTGTTTFTNLTASTALALDASKNVVSVTNTGSGNNVLATSPTLVTPDLGTPSALVVTHATGTASININGTVGATTPTTGAFTTATLSSNLTLNGGTANGVLFLNGSKVATSGSALTFDGTNLLLNTAAGRFKLGNSGDTTTHFIDIVDTNGSAFFFGVDNSAGTFFGAGAFGRSIYSEGNHPILFFVNAAQKMRLSSDGTFRVKGAGSAGTTDAVQFSGSAPANSLILNSTGNLTLSAEFGASTAALTLKNTTAFNALNIVEQQFFAGNSFTGLDIIAKFGALNPSAGANNFGALYWSLANSGAPTEKMRLDNTGLGIGTTSPSERLEVVGVAKVRTSGGSGIQIVSASTPYIQAFASSGNNVLQINGQSISFHAGASFAAEGEKMRLSSDGTFRVKGAGSAGTTDAVQFSGGAPANSLILDSNGFSFQGSTAYYNKKLDVLGLPNDGTFEGFLILAKAHVSGLQNKSVVQGTFTLIRGSTGSDNRNDVYYVNSSSAYNSENLTVKVSTTNIQYFTETVKVTYGGVVYHAIRTSVSGGRPDNGVWFNGVAYNASPIYVDATYVSSITSFGYADIANEAGSGAFALQNGQIRFPVTQNASSNANTLDDYEEGSHVASMTATSGGSITLASDLKTLSYIKIGRQVTMAGRIRIQSISSPSGLIRISLPFQVDTSLPEESAFVAFNVPTHDVDLVAGTVQVFAEAGKGATAASIYQVLDNLPWTGLQGSQLKGTGNEYFYLAGTYVCAN
jgi:hypothetical protein